MAKHNRSVTGKQINSPQGKGTSFEQHESYDDSLLPDAAELSKLKEIDPNVVEWIKLRTEKEQDARHKFNERKLKLVESGTNKAFTIDMFSIIAAFLIVICGMGFSYLLIKENQVITGTVFAGATILLAANSFLGFRKNQKIEKK